MKNTIIYLVLITSIFACRKPTNPEFPLPDLNVLGCDYNQYSTSDYDSVGVSYIQFAPIDPYILLDDYDYYNPIFNPNNSCQIIYARHNNQGVVGLQAELWKFDFDTGESTLIYDQYYYNADWGSNGWIVFTNYDYQVYKIKDNGDSLTQLTFDSDFADHFAGKWNPSATMFWNKKNGHTQYVNPDGLLIHEHNTIPFSIIDWIDDSTIIGSQYGHLYSLSIPDENLTLLNTNEIGTGSSYQQLLDRENMQIYCEYVNADEDKRYYLRYDISGSNAVDTLTRLYDSYLFLSEYVNRIGDSQDGKIITTLRRAEYPDTTVNQYSIRHNILIMDLDCSNQRLLELP